MILQPRGQNLEQSSSIQGFDEVVVEFVGGVGLALLASRLFAFAASWLSGFSGFSAFHASRLFGFHDFLEGATLCMGRRGHRASRPPA